MIYHSDNTAANLLIEHVGLERVNALGSEFRLTRTHLGHLFGAVVMTSNDENEAAGLAGGL